MWHAIIALGQHTPSDYVNRGKPSSPLGNTHGQATSGVASHHRSWKVYMMGRHWRGMLSSPLENTHDRTTSGMAYQHRPWAAHTVIIFIMQHTRSNNVERDSLSCPFDSTHGGTRPGVSCHHHPSTTYTIELRRAWHAINTLGQHTRSDVV